MSGEGRADCRGGGARTELEYVGIQRWGAPGGEETPG